MDRDFVLRVVEEKGNVHLENVGNQDDLDVEVGSDDGFVFALLSVDDSGFDVLYYCLLDQVDNLLLDW